MKLYFPMKATGNKLLPHTFDYVTADARLRHPLAKYLSVNAGIRAQYYSAAAANNVNNSLDSSAAAIPAVIFLVIHFMQGWQPEWCMMQETI